VRPIVIAYHLIWTAYGWWLPNDPRGSMSKEIAGNVIADLGKLHFGRKRIQPSSKSIRDFYDRARNILKFPLLTFERAERECVAEAVDRAIVEYRYKCYALAVMPDHVHALIRKHKHDAEQMIENLQEFSRKLVRERGFRTYDHPVWGDPGWKVFLDHPDDVWRTIRYVNQNPLKMRMPAQQHAFVSQYDNWPLHRGHSPNSPYVKRLREK